MCRKKSRRHPLGPPRASSMSECKNTRLISSVPTRQAYAEISMLSDTTTDWLSKRAILSAGRTVSLSAVASGVRDVRYHVSAPRTQFEARVFEKTMQRLFCCPLIDSSKRKLATQPCISPSKESPPELVSTNSLNMLRTPWTDYKLRFVVGKSESKAPNPYGGSSFILGVRFWRIMMAST